MEVIKKINLLIVSIILQLILIPFRIAICLLKLVETILRVSRLTVKYFIHQLECEILDKNK